MYSSGPFGDGPTARRYPVRVPGVAILTPAHAGTVGPVAITALALSLLFGTRRETELSSGRAEIPPTRAARAG